MVCRDDDMSIQVARHHYAADETNRFGRPEPLTHLLSRQVREDLPRRRARLGGQLIVAVQYEQCHQAPQKKRRVGLRPRQLDG
jgi:hypothetical protein